MATFPALSTSIPASQDALYAVLNDSPGRNGVACSLGFPLQRKLEHVWVEGKATEIKRDYDVSGMREFTESYLLAVTVFVNQKAADMASVRDRAAQIEAWAEGAITSNPTLSGAVDQAQAAVVEYAEGVPADNEREFAITIGVRISATVSETTSPVC